MDGHTGLQPPLAGMGSQGLNPGPSSFPLCRPLGSPHIMRFWGASRQAPRQPLKAHTCLSAPRLGLREKPGISPVCLLCPCLSCWQWGV